MFRRKKHFSADQTAEFYDHLVQGSENRALLGMSNRYDGSKRMQEIFLNKYFDNVVSLEIKEEDNILDFGCGPGIFTSRLAKFGKSVVGVDISKEFIQQAVNRVTLENTEFIHVKSNLADALGANRRFNVLVLVDVIHHLDDIKPTLEDALTYLNPGGKVLVYEPNILNPVLFAIHLLDPNERGLLRLGKRKIYLEIFQDLGYKCDKVNWSGIVIGPANWVFLAISRALSLQLVNKIFGWLNPKIYLVFRKPL